MATLSLEDFKNYAQLADIVPVYEDILQDTSTPLGLFLNIEAHEHAFLFESLEGGEKWGRYSFMGFGAKQVFTSSGKKVTVSNGSFSKCYTADDPLEELKKLLSAFKVAPLPEMPRLATGMIGFVSYDMVRFIENLPASQRGATGEIQENEAVPDCFFFLPEVLIVHDNLKQQLRIIANVFVTSKDETRLQVQYEEAREKLKNTIKLLRKAGNSSALPESASYTLEPVSNFSRSEFEEIVRKAKGHIISGDCIQIVVSQRFTVPLRTAPINIYRALRHINPSPYLFYLKLSDLLLLGSSPEILVRLDSNGIQLRPIAGTRPRGRTEEEDRELERELLNDEKERAEHIMLVDLGRNDVGRVARIGTVRVDELMVVERYSHVMHLVSNVVGKLAPGLGPVDVLRAVFPAGTVSGAPKVRAMEIIDELEKERRGPYAGAVGYFDFSGNMDFCINIRSFFINDNQVHFQVGAGIVADSQPTSEYFETINKAKALIRALEWAYSC